MTTSNATLDPTHRTIGTFGNFTVLYDPEPTDDEGPDPYPYSVMDVDGDRIDWYATRREAVANARERAEEEAAELADERRQELRDAIAEAMEDCEDEATLAAVLVLLKRKAK